ncbi:MAG: SDR family oxidoreductase [Cyclobacteriaceae bacterium]
MNLDLKSRKALVCGSSQGIGKAVALSLAEEGAEITLVARNKSKLQAVQNNLAGAGHIVFPADLSEKEGVDALIRHLSENTYDIVINNTGGPAPGDIDEANIDQFQKAIEMHLFASHMIMQHVLPSMKEKQYGRFINVISTSVKIPIKGLGVSNTIRGAMASWSKTLSLELGQYGITVNNILPGFIDTDRLQSLIASIAEGRGVTKDEVADEMKTTIPAGRFGDAGEIGKLAAFLASPAAAYINGVNIPVDGGRTGSM